MTKMNQNHIIVVLLLVLVGAGGFVGGMKYQESNREQFMTGQFGGRRSQGGMMQGRRFGGAGMQGFSTVAGEILSIDDKSLTVKLPDGSSKIVLFSDTTAIIKPGSGSKDDLTFGTKIGVFGPENADGSMTAQSIQLNPPLRGLEPKK